MKTFIVSAVTAIGLSLCSQSAQARSWRINSNPDAKAHFTSINAAMESLEVFKGDTLYLDPGCVLNNQSITKGVTIIGPGYDLDENVLGNTSLGGKTLVNQKGSNTKIEGCHLAYIEMTNSSNITVERCKIGFIHHNGCSNISYLSCFIYGKSGSYHHSLYDMNYSTLFITNCIILNGIRGIQNTSTITNNVIFHDGYGVYQTPSTYTLENVKNATITNNIIINTSTGYKVDDDQIPYFYKNNNIENTAVTDNNTISNNVLSTESKHAFANHPNNKFIGATAADVFTLTGKEDAMYRLKAGSPAIGYGANGYDCGVYSGAYPYVESGRPRFMPYIYDARIPNQPTDGKLNVTLKIKSQNE
ncbi:MAG: hypothetical protein NC388_11095 [Clostridium sp.]|nr:hypothetical protein [Clostridium sp.]